MTPVALNNILFSVLKSLSLDTLGKMIKMVQVPIVSMKCLDAAIVWAFENCF